MGGWTERPLVQMGYGGTWWRAHPGLWGLGDYGEATRGSKGRLCAPTLGIRAMGSKEMGGPSPGRWGPSHSEWEGRSQGGACLEEHTLADRWPAQEGPPGARHYIPERQVRAGYSFW